MSKTDTDATSDVPVAPGRRRSPRPEDRQPVDVEEPRSEPVASSREKVALLHDGPPDGDEQVFLSETVRRMGRRRTRLFAVVSLIVAVVATALIVDAFMAPEPATAIDQATGEAWSAVAALSDGLRELGRDGELEPLRDDARTARKEVQAAGARMKELELPISQTPLRSRVIRALRADDAWIAAVGSTLANPRSRRRGDLARLAKRAATGTALLGDDVAGAAGSVGGTGRLLSATKRRG